VIRWKDFLIDEFLGALLDLPAEERDERSIMDDATVRTLGSVLNQETDVEQKPARKVGSQGSNCDEKLTAGTPIAFVPRSKGKEGEI